MVQSLVVTLLVATLVELPVAMWPADTQAVLQVELPEELLVVTLVELLVAMLLGDTLVESLAVM
jgi:hypothetical protein